MQLSDEQRAVLDFEQAWANRPASPGAKEAAIGDTFGVTSTRYYQRVVALLDDPAAIQYAPATVLRLGRLLARRRRR